MCNRHDNDFGKAKIDRGKVTRCLIQNKKLNNIPGQHKIINKNKYLTLVLFSITSYYNFVLSQCCPRSISFLGPQHSTIIYFMNIFHLLIKWKQFNCVLELFDSTIKYK